MLLCFLLTAALRQSPDSGTVYPANCAALQLQVYKAKRYRTTVVALKMLVASDDALSKEIVEALQLELQIMKEARHPHIVTCFDACQQASL